MLEPIAQELALSIAEVIGYDVLITDVDGIIIGCSDPDRGLGTLNESSRIAARTGRGSVDTEDVAKLLKGTRPGVTYPVVDLENRVIGTVAITGDPDKVKPFALVVKRQAELYIRERTVMKEVLERERNLQTLISDIYLFKPRINDPDLVSNRAEQFGYDSSLSYSALAFEIRRVPGYRDTVGRDRLLLRLKECFGGARSIVGAMKLDLYVAFVPCTARANMERDFYLSLEEKCRWLENQFASMGMVGTVGIGTLGRGIEGLARSCKEARLALRIGRRTSSSSSLHPIWNYRVEEVLFSSPRVVMDQMSKRELSPLEDRGDRDDLCHTLVAWCESGFNVTKTSELLHVHRTTVNYRLEKLSSLFKADMRDFREMSRIYWALIMERLNRDVQPTVDGISSISQGSP